MNVKDEQGLTPFMAACLHGHKEVVQLLLDTSVGNIDFNAKGKRHGMTAFFMACCMGRKDVVKLLLDHPGGAIDFNAKAAKDGEEISVCKMAFHTGQTDVVKMLLQQPKGTFDCLASIDNDEFYHAIELMEANGSWPPWGI